MQRHREVRRDGGPADAALWREERDDLAGLAYARGRRERVHRHRRSRRGCRVASALDLLELVDVANGVDQLVRGERLHEELARAGEHRAAQVILLALNAHHDDRRLGDGVRDDLSGCDPVHVGHVDVHEDHVRSLFLRERHGLLTTARYLHVTAHRLGQIGSPLDLIDLSRVTH